MHAVHKEGEQAPSHLVIAAPRGAAKAAKELLALWAGVRNRDVRDHAL